MVFRQYKSFGRQIIKRSTQYYVRFYLYKSERQYKAALCAPAKQNDRDIYWVNSRTGDVQDIEATFRVDGKVPELWFCRNR